MDSRESKEDFEKDEIKPKLTGFEPKLTGFVK